MLGSTSHTIRDRQQEVGRTCVACLADFFFLLSSLRNCFGLGILFMMVNEGYVFDSGELVEDIKKQSDYIIGALVGDVDKKHRDTVPSHAFVDTAMPSSNHPYCGVTYYRGKRTISYLYPHGQRTEMMGKFGENKDTLGGI